MAISIQISGMTQQQQQEVGNAFDSIGGRQIAGPLDADGKPTPLTKAQWVERCLLRHIKAVVKGAKRQTHEEAISAEFTQVDLDYPEA